MSRPSLPLPIDTLTHIDRQAAPRTRKRAPRVTAEKGVTHAHCRSICNRTRQLTPKHHLCPIAKREKETKKV